MSSFTYNGHDFSGYVSAELVEPAGLVVDADVAEVPGRPGRALVSGDLEPLTLHLRIFMDNSAFSTSELASVRRMLRGWLAGPYGGVLVVPGEPTLEWHDAVCTGVSDWSSLFADGSAVVTFTCYDPISYGEAKETKKESFEVGGTWDTWPVYVLYADDGDSLSVAEGGKGFTVEHAFEFEDLVIVETLSQTVSVNGTDATADVTLGSDFLALSPGSHELAFTGCSTHSVQWRERWA